MIHLLANTIYDQAAEVRVTNDSLVAADTDFKLNVTGGQRHLKWRQTSAAKRLINYTEPGAGLSARFVVLTNANIFEGHAIAIQSWTSLWSGNVVHFTSSGTFSETKYGPKNHDWVYDLGTLTGKAAIGIEMNDGTGGSYVRKCGKLYFSDPVSFDGFASKPEYANQNETLLVGEQAYQIDETMRCSFGPITRAQVESIQNLPDIGKEPFFLYDEDGHALHETLLHVIALDYSFQALPASDDVFLFNLLVGRLRQ